MESVYEFSLLFDFYGGLLTERQRDFFELYHNDDLSLSEIAESAGVSRQAVHDAVVRAEATLTETEQHVGLVARFQQTQNRLDSILSCVGQAARMNYETIHSDDLGVILGKISSLARELKA